MVEAAGIGAAENRWMKKLYTLAENSNFCGDGIPGGSRRSRSIAKISADRVLASRILSGRTRATVRTYCWNARPNPSGLFSGNNCAAVPY